MIGAIIGDIVGSVYEWDYIKTTEFDLFSQKSIFTDDTVMTIATARTLLEKMDYAESYREYGKAYPGAGYGSRFNQWVFSDSMGPYNSYGNGSAMRVSPIGFAYDDIEAALQEAKRSAEVTHNHPEGIKGAQATVMAIILARQGVGKEEIRRQIQKRFDYNLNRTCEDIRPTYKFDVSCQGTVPEAIIAFLDSVNFEDAIRKAVSLGGDSDTLACITGGIAQAFYKEIPEDILIKTQLRLPGCFLVKIDKFNQTYLS